MEIVNPKKRSRYSEPSYPAIPPNVGFYMKGKKMITVDVLTMKEIPVKDGSQIDITKTTLFSLMMQQWEAEKILPCKLFSI